MHAQCTGNGMRGTFNTSFRIMFIGTTLSNTSRKCTREISSLGCVDNINYDRVTKSPQSSVGDRLGIHQTREFVTEASALGLKIPKLKGGKCGEKGQNKRTCKNQEMDLTL